ncbi:MAG: CPBP family intramembrane glutamic endopeptidase [Roseburia sp.]
MKDFFKLEKPKVVYEAAEKQRGMHWALELLVFVLVFLAASLGEALVLMPGELLMLFGDEAYREAAIAQDMEAATAAAAQLASSDLYTILMLFSNLGLILVVWLFCRLLQKRRMTSLGFRKPGLVREYVCGLGAGFAAFSAAVLLCVITGAVRLEGLSATFSAGIFLLFVVGYMIQGMAEEVLCRGYFMVSVARRYPMALAVFANALFFAALHLLNNGISVLAFINLTLFGVFASVYFVKRGNIWGIGAFHSVWNLVQGNFYGIRVSGMETECSIFSSQMVSGKELWNGGAFGLEGGLAVTIVLLVGIAILLTMKAKDVPERAEEFLEPENEGEDILPEQTVEEITAETGESSAQ